MPGTAFSTYDMSSEPGSGLSIQVKRSGPNSSTIVDTVWSVSAGSFTVTG